MTTGDQSMRDVAHASPPLPAPRVSSARIIYHHVQTPPPTLGLSPCIGLSPLPNAHLLAGVSRQLRHAEDVRIDERVDIRANANGQLHATLGSIGKLSEKRVLERHAL